MCFQITWLSLLNRSLEQPYQLFDVDVTLSREVKQFTNLNLSGIYIGKLNLRPLLQLCPSLRELDRSGNHLVNRLINSTSMQRGDQLTGLNSARN